MKTKTQHSNANLMNKLYFLFLLVATFGYAQNVTFADPELKAVLTAPVEGSGYYAQDINDNFIAVDADGDGEVQVSEALNVYKLQLGMNSFGEISDLGGVEAFANLKYLRAEYMPITNIDAVISGLNNLEGLRFLECGLTTLDLSTLTNLTDVAVDHCQLTSLNVSNLTNLKYLSCGVNHLTTLDLSDLTSMEDFVCVDNDLTSLDLSGLNNLKYLYASFNNLTSMDFHALPNLWRINVEHNQIASMNLNGLASLEWIEFYYNQMTTVDFSGLNNLRLIICNNNNFTDLDFSVLPAAENIVCNNNQLVSLNVSGLNNVWQLICSYNMSLTNLQMTTLPALQSLNCMVCQLPSLDLSGSPLLQGVDCRWNNLTTLNLKNGANESAAFASNPNLQFVCVDDAQYQTVYDLTQQPVGLGYNNFTVVNSYCTMTPGGDSNQINGTVLFDANANGCDSNDTPHPFVKIDLDNNSDNGSAFTDANGNYTFYTNTGTFTLTPNLEMPAYFTVTPPSATVDFPVPDHSVSQQNFCIEANGVHPDVEVIIAPHTPARPGFDATYKIVYRNKGNQTLSGTVGFAFEDNVLDFVASTPNASSQSTGSLAYDYSSLLPFESREIVITLNVNSPTEIPAVNNGDALVFTAVIDPATGDDVPSDNTFTYHQTVVNSFDPNDKVCVEGDLVNPNQIGGYLHYIINFENSGTAAAQNIVITDVIDTAKFDIGSLQMLNSSHPVNLRINGNKVEFIFENINLPSILSNPIGGHGNVLFKIKTLPTLQVGDMVSNTANIHFDYNHPIETNEARTTFATLKRQEFMTDNSVIVYPNPAKNFVSVKANKTIQNMVLYDVQGRILESETADKNAATIDVSD